MINKIRSIKWLVFCGKLLLSLLIGLEITGRLMGLGKQPLYQKDKSFEYIAQPNQDLYFMGNRFATNEYSMRSDPVDPADTDRILLLGDSIIFGKNSTDNDSLASAVLQRMLSFQLKKKVLVLNISMTGWNPANIVAYLKRYGTFSAKGMVLVVNSLDAFEKMSFSPLVFEGVGGLKTSDHYFAMQTLVEKGLVKLMSGISSGETEALKPASESFNPGFAALDSMCKSQGIPLTIYLHSMGDETTTKNYSRGGQEIIQFCKARNIPLMQGIINEDKSLYLDQGHFSNSGQRFLATALDSIALRIMAN